jgi:alkylated DNA repair dioxygenase AlkB
LWIWGSPVRAGVAVPVRDMAPRQLSLLQQSASTPEGFVYRPDVISPEEERELLERVRALPFKEFEFQGYRGKRRVVSFGLHYDFAHGRLEPTADMPEFLLPVREKAACFAGLTPEELPHVLVTEYSIGAPIGWHKDRPSFEDVIGISLLSACRFRFRKRLEKGWARTGLVLQPRSAYLLRGPARSEWEHSIPEAESLRYSITFRSLRRKNPRRASA